MFEHLEQLWMGIWQHTHTVTTTEVFPDLGELAEILDDVSVELSCVLPFTLYPFWTGVRVKGNPYPVITR